MTDQSWGSPPQQPSPPFQQGPQQPPPSPAQQPPPPAVPSVGSRFVRTLGLRLLLGLLGLLGVGGYYLYLRMKDRASFVWIDNPTPAEVLVTLDGNDLGAIPAGGHIQRDVTPGNHAIVVRNAAGPIEQSTFEVAERAGFFDGFHGVYSIGGNSLYVVENAIYNQSGGDTNFTEIGENQRFFRVPSHVEGDLNEKFPSEVYSQTGSSSMTHICRVHADGEGTFCDD